jgi:hypothetical protein
MPASEPLLTPQLRAALRDDLTPSAHDRARGRDGVWSAMAANALSPSALRVDAAMRVKLAGLKVGAAATGHALATKLIVASLIAVSAVAAVTTNLTRAPHARPAAVSTAKEPSLASRTAADAPRAPAAQMPQPSAAAPERAEPVTPAANPARAPANADAASPRRRNRAARPSPIATQGVRAADSNAPTDASLQQPAAPEQTASQPAAASHDAPPSAAAPSSTLAAEFALVRAASAALDRHQPDLTIALMQRYAVEHPSGTLRVEAEALRVLALCNKRDASAATARESFLHAHAKSALAERIQRACHKL